MLDSQLDSQEAIKNSELCVNESNLKYNACGEEYNKEKLLIQLKDELLKENSNEENKFETLFSIISKGIYSEIALSKLLRNGMTKKDILKVMKFGLQNLQCDELNYFRTFNITPENLKCTNMLLENINQELIMKLQEIGFSKEDSLDIILTGLINQNQCNLFQLTLKGISVGKILNWQDSKSSASKSMITFLEKLGFDENILTIVAEKGVNKEAQKILAYLCYSESNKNIIALPNQEDDKCYCKLETEEANESCPSCCERSEHTSTCSCSDNDANEKVIERKKELLETKNYLRQNLMAPLTWAMSEALKYNPSSPTHFVACQLNRWIYNNIDPLEKNDVLEFVAEATTKMDQKLVNEKMKKTIFKLNK